MKIGISGSATAEPPRLSRQRRPPVASSAPVLRRLAGPASKLVPSGSAVVGAATAADIVCWPRRHHRYAASCSTADGLVRSLSTLEAAAAALVVSPSTPVSVEATVVEVSFEATAVAAAAVAAMMPPAASRPRRHRRGRWLSRPPPSEAPPSRVPR